LPEFATIAKWTAIGTPSNIMTPVNCSGISPRYTVALQHEQKKRPAKQVKNLYHCFHVFGHRATVVSGHPMDAAWS
jgi:hypothetical protein